MVRTLEGLLASLYLTVDSGPEPELEPHGQNQIPGIEMRKNAFCIELFCFGR